MRIIPAIDIYEGQCVRLKKGAYSERTAYPLLPCSAAQQFANAGARHLHVVDLEGAKQGRIVNWDAIRQICAVPGVSIQVGGGIRSEKDIEALFMLGVSHVVVGSIAVRSPHVLESWIKKYGAQRFCAALDVKGAQAAYGAWESLDRTEIGDIIRRVAASGIERILSTDIERDGMLEGPNVSYYASLVEQYPSIEWLASGGVRGKEDIRSLQKTGVCGAVIGKALYDGLVTLEELTEI